MIRLTRMCGRLALVGVMVFAMVAGSFGVRSATFAQSDVPLTAEYVPSDAVLYVAIDTHILSPQWIQLATLVQRIDDGANAEALPRNLLENAFEQDDDSIDLDFTPFVGGEVAALFIGAGALLDQSSSADFSDDPLATAEDLVEGMVVVAVPSNLAAAEAELLRALGDVAESRGLTIEESSYRDYTISSVAADTANGTPGIAIVTAGDAVAIALTAAQLEPIIDRADGIGESITEIGGFDAATAPLPDERVLFGLLNGPTLIQDGFALPVIGPALEAFVPGGANGVTAFTVSAEPNGVRVHTRTVGSDGNPGRTFGEHIDSNLIDNLPADTQIAVSGNDLASTRLVDGVLVLIYNLVFGTLGGAFSEFEDEGSATPEPLPATFEGYVEQAYGMAEAFLSVDLKADFVDLLDGEFLFGVINAGSSHQTIGFVSETSDPAALGGTVQNLLFVAGFLMGGAPETNAAGLSEVDLGGGAGTLELGMVDDTLVLGVGGVTTLLAEPEESLVESDVFQAATESLPVERSLLIFVNIGSLQAGSSQTAPVNTFGLGSQSEAAGPAFAFVAFNDGDEMGGEGYVYIPEP